MCVSQRKDRRGRKRPGILQRERFLELASFREWEQMVFLTKAMTQQRGARCRLRQP